MMSMLHYFTIILVVPLAMCDDIQNVDNQGIPIPTEDLGQDIVNDLKHQITKDHVLEELEYQINMKEKKDMTDRELQFHYFKLHDFDGNNLLDGLEIVKALKHSHDEAKAEGHTPVDTGEAELMSIVDSVLETDDFNKDGYVSFHEFMASQDST